MGATTPETRPHSFFLGGVSHIARYKLAVGLLIAFTVVFNLTDLATSSFALQIGLREANSLVLAISGALGLNIFASLVLVKVIFVTGAAVVALMGVRSRDRRIRNLMLQSLTTSTFIFLALSLNNLYWIAR
jgi:hypothetical protein